MTIQAQWEEFKENIISNAVKRTRPLTAPPRLGFKPRKTKKEILKEEVAVTNFLDAHLFFQQDSLDKTYDVKCSKLSRARRLATIVVARDQKYKT